MYRAAGPTDFWTVMATLVLPGSSVDRTAMKSTPRHPNESSAGLALSFRAVLFATLPKGDHRMANCRRT